ncbi:uncharacterized protein [Clytia hemisphaerica]|uniref:uncharacterized protein isoform X1 n=1 Tax=Clytia hemisphaerica TaxID=252671 RepID=UPI0034D60A76|eukprot:TCONS_00016233-protein
MGCCRFFRRRRRRRPNSSSSVEETELNGVTQSHNPPRTAENEDPRLVDFQKETEPWKLSLNQIDRICDPLNRESRIPNWRRLAEKLCNDDPKKSTSLKAHLDLKGGPNRGLLLLKKLNTKDPSIRIDQIKQVADELKRNDIVLRLSEDQFQDNPFLSNLTIISNIYIAELLNSGPQNGRWDLFAEKFHLRKTEIMKIQNEPRNPDYKGPAQQLFMNTMREAGRTLYELKQIMREIKRNDLVIEINNISKEELDGTLRENSAEETSNVDTDSV